jgi:hypothetical protein
MEAIATGDRGDRMNANMKSLQFFAAGILASLPLMAQDAATNVPASASPPPETNAAPAVIPPFELNPPPVAPVGADGLIVQSDNLHPPYMAVFKGSVNGIKSPYGANNCDAYAAWLNRKVIWAEDNQPGDWGNVEGQSWQLQPWGQWVDAVPGRRFILGVAIIPGAWDGSGPKTGLDANKPVSFEEGATGAYNEHYKKLAEKLVKYHLGNSILRLGVEFNGGWFAWHVKGEGKAAAFAGYWKQIVTTMRAVPGAEKLQFCWNPGACCYCDFKPDTAWPGDEYVDYVGLDFYDDSYASNTYPIAKTASPEEAEAIHEKVWDTVYMNGAFGLAYWKKFAETHNKPLCFPEWGEDNKPDHHGGGDDPYFIEQMYKFIYTPANNVAWHSYFDYQAGDGHHQLSPKLNGTVITEFPKSAAKFKELFSLPANTH